MAHLCHYLVRAGKAVVEEVEDLVNAIADDTLVQRGLEADLGLPEGALDRVKDKDTFKPPPLTGIDDYLDDLDADAEKLAVAIDNIKAYAAFWRALFSAVNEEHPEVVVEEVLYRLFEYATTDLMKYEHPTFYAWMRLLRIFTFDVRTAFEETFAPEVAASIFTAEYWKTVRQSYHNFRLDQTPDFVPDEPGPTTAPDEATRLRQLSERVFGRSDLAFGLSGAVLWYLTRQQRDSPFDQIYGWETPRRPRLPPCLPAPGTTGIPLPDHIASRAWTMRLRGRGDGSTTTATLTQMFLEEADGRFGWLLSLRGGVTFDEQTGSKERPVKIKVKVEANEGLDAVIYLEGDGDRFLVSGTPKGAMSVSMEPAKPAIGGAAFSLPDSTGTRLEIGDFTFKLEIAAEGFKLQAAAKKSAFVIVTRETGPLVKHELKTKETRIEFDFGVTATQDGISIDGGGRLAANIPLNWSAGPFKANSIQLALTPKSSPSGSELVWTALGSFGFDLEPLYVTVEQMGVELELGSSRDGVPGDAKELIPSLLYARNLGFRPPSGLGIRLDGDVVSGGGFLFYDREKQEYAGILQLDFGRLAITAIGLLTQNSPEAGEGYSFLIIFTLEFDPPLQLGPLALFGIGGLYGHHRGMDTNALRAGLRNRTLDAVLFPKDPIANAGRILGAIRTVFPPARGTSVAGPVLKLGWGAGVAPFIVAELALVFEWGASSRRALMGQVELALPRDVEKGKRVKKVLEVHVDALGIWDRQNGDFSLDMTLYDSHIAFITLAGDAALRMKRGETFLFSIGGYHPEFAAPPTFPKLERLTIKLSDSKDFRLILTGYFALTSNTRQIGALIDFYAKAKSVSFEAKISFDALFTEDAGFSIDFDVEMKIKYKSMTLFGVSVSGRFTGPNPRRVRGEWSVDLWLFSIGGPFDFTLGPETSTIELPVTNPAPALVAALHEQRNWSAPLPADRRQLVSFRSRPGSGEVLVHPLGELSVVQQVLPLGIELDLFGGGVPQGQRRFEITKAFLGDDPVTTLRPMNEAFAAADFLELTDDEKLHRPSFERMPAGVSLSPKAVGFGGQTAATANHAADSAIDFEEIVIDPDGNIVRDEQPHPLSTVLVLHSVAFGPAAQSQLRNSGPGKFETATAGLAVGPERFTVAGVDDLAPAAMNGSTPSDLSHAAVAQALARHLEENPELRGKLQVVPTFTVNA